MARPWPSPALYGLEVRVWQVGASYDSKPYRRLMIEAFGAGAPSFAVRADRSRSHLRADPANASGSLGIAISRRSRSQLVNPDIRYALGSVFQPRASAPDSDRAREALLQMEMAGDTPTMIVGCTGGGSNFAGLSFPFLREKLAGRISPEIVAAEPCQLPVVDPWGVRLRLRRHRRDDPADEDAHLGHDFVPDPIHAGGLRYHGMAPLISHVYDQGLMTAEAVPRPRLSAAVQFARTEGIVAAPEPTHALALAIREAKGPRNRRGNGHPHGTVRMATSTCRPTTPASTAGWSTRTSPTLGCPTRWRLCRRSRSGRTALRSVAA